MGYLLRRWLADRLPKALTQAERAVALEIADLANDNTGLAYGKDVLPTVARRAGLANPKQVGAVLTNLSRDRKLELRVEVITSSGKKAFAYRGHQTTYMIPRAGSVLAAESPDGAVWEPDPRDPGKRRGGGKADGKHPSLRELSETTTAVDVAAEKVPPPQDLPGEKGAEDHGERCRDLGRKVPPNPGKVPPPRDPSPHFSSETSPQPLPLMASPADMLAAAGVPEGEREDLIPIIESQNRVQSFGWWINARRNGTLGRAIDSARQELADGAVTMPWCGKCNERTREVETESGCGIVTERCPGCHPAEVMRHLRPAGASSYGNQPRYQPYRDDPTADYHAPL